MHAGNTYVKALLISDWESSWIEEIMEDRNPEPHPSGRAYNARPRQSLGSLVSSNRVSAFIADDHLNKYVKVSFRYLFPCPVLIGSHHSVLPVR